MFITKKICIIGLNDAFISSLIEVLVKRDSFVTLVLVEAKKSGKNYYKDILNRTSVVKIDSEEANIALSQADIIINALVSPTPSVISKLRNHLMLSNKLISNYSYNGMLIQIHPLIVKNTFSYFYKGIKNLEGKIVKNIKMYNIVKIPVILSNSDSIVQDIEKIYNRYKKAFKKSYEFSYIDRDDLTEALSNMIFSKVYNKKSFELGSSSKVSLNDLNTLILNNRSLKGVTFYEKFLLKRVYKMPLHSFSSKYLSFLQLSKKSSQRGMNLRSLNVEMTPLSNTLMKYKILGKNELDS